MFWNWNDVVLESTETDKEDKEDGQLLHPLLDDAIVAPVRTSSTRFLMDVIDGKDELQIQEEMLYPMYTPLTFLETPSTIRNVWADNLREEFKLIRKLARDKTYSVIAMDTEFPGVVTYPVGIDRKDYQYQLIRANCDTLRLIQVGFSLMDQDGNSPPGISTWQFNFKFNLAQDMHAEDSIKMLKNCGIQFEKHETDGIDSMNFSELFISSGLVCCEDVQWVSFHSGYDVGYLYRVLSGRPLPEDEKEFVDMLKTYFPNLYDIKYLLEYIPDFRMRGGLQFIADLLNVQRIGAAHQAGSDSLLTGKTFFEIRNKYFEDKIDESRYNGRVYGFKESYAEIDNVPCPPPTSDCDVYLGPPHFR